MMLWSHDNPKQTLQEHLLGVGRWGAYFMQNSWCKAFEEIPTEYLHDFLILHDVGKATKYFQEYLLEKKDTDELRYHAKFSAVFFVAFEIEKGILDKDSELIMAMFYAILKHHSDLVSIRSAYYDINVDKKNRKALLRQWESIPKDELKALLKNCRLSGYEGILEKSFEDSLDEVEKFLRKQRRTHKYLYKDGKTKSYFQTQILYSVLIDADKSQVGLKNLSIVNREFYNADVHLYIKGKNPKPTMLNELRANALREVEQNITTSDKITTLTLPTGMGKTLTSFSAAVKIRNELLEETGLRYKIIYVMPFMSIIDQNAEVLESILKEQNDKVASNILLKHHHLAELAWKTNENENLKAQNAKILIEGWNSEIIITTFHQFFLTLIGYKNGMQRKFHKLANAIILIDEIQAIPVKYYTLVGNMLKMYTEEMNSKIIAMTATQPHIFAKGCSRELCDSKKYYEHLSRTRIINQFKEKQSIDEFVLNIECEDTKTYLFIVNTIACGRDLYNKLKEKYPECQMTFLSTLLTPSKRKSRIHDIQKKKYQIVVSTQLVEAGVDVDFDVVYRDFAPLPSIFQSAGRSNREGDLKKIGLVYVVNLCNDKGNEYCKMVYKNSIVDIKITKEVLVNEEYSESEFMNVIEAYFDRISSREVKSQYESDKILKGIECQLFYREKDKNDSEIAPVSDFALIEDTGDKYSIFIEEDKNASDLWEKYCELSNTRDKDWEQKIELKSISRKMADYIVNVGANIFESNNKPPKGANEIYYYVSKEEISKYYNEEMGYGVLSPALFY